MNTTVDAYGGQNIGPERIGFKVLWALSLTHFLNDMLQSLIPAIYPLLKSTLSLSFTQIGLITLTYQIAASLFQPAIGLYTDHHPLPYSLPIGMGSTLMGLIALGLVPTYGLLLVAVSLVGVGSSIFHPESSRVARMASAGRYGLAQSIFQVGGNTGTAMGPLLAAAVVMHQGRHSISWFSLVALLAILILIKVGGWYKCQILLGKRLVKAATQLERPVQKTVWPVSILLVLIFSKFFYMASLNSYYIFYLISKFHLSVKSAQLHLFVFLAAAALGTILGGPIGDHVGRKRVIYLSILGVAPFTLALPYASLTWTAPLTFIIGLILSSAFPAILVYAQELFPGKVGMVSGMFFGLAFGMAGIGAAVLGKLADLHGIDYVYHLCSFLPLLGLLAGFLPDISRSSHNAPS